MSAVLADPPPVLSPAELSTSITESWRRWIVNEEGRAPSSAPNVYASAFNDCTRAMALDLVAGDRRPKWTAEQLANFRRGKDRERNLLADLSKIGRDATPQFEVIGGQEWFGLRDRRGRQIISGMLDAKLRFANGVKAPIEVKGWSPNLVARIHVFEDLFDNRFTRSGAHQLLAYLYATNQEFGFLIIDRHGVPLLLPVVLTDDNMMRLEDFLQKAERAMDAKELVQAGGGWSDNNPEIADVLPPFHDEPEHCRSCKYFGHTCNPAISYEAASVITDDDLITAVETAMANKQAHDLYEEAWGVVKTRLRGVEQAIGPTFMYHGKWQKQTKYDIPDSVKAPYKKVDPKGKFVGEVTPL